MSTANYTLICPPHFLTMIVYGLIDTGAAGVYNSMSNQWSCCSAYGEHAVGCYLRPHECEEVMLTVRAEAAPSIHIGASQFTIYMFWFLPLWYIRLYNYPNTQLLPISS